jgi:hypothetical protein
MHTLPLPESGTNETISIETLGPIVVVGANGSGKTRLNAWIQSELVAFDMPVQRIAAQKMLDLPSVLSLTSPDSAELKWVYGRNHWTGIQRNPENKEYARQARITKWGQNAAIATSDDYAELLEFLLAEHATEILRHSERMEQLKELLPFPETRLRRIQRIWEDVLPGRSLKIGTGKLETELTDGPIYNSAEMSDGERVIFYLLGSCIGAPPNAILLIDEPEVHLHRIIQRRLWDLVERGRPDCLFVYFTHDLEFAASRSGATRIVLNKFDGTRWFWSEVPAESDLPADLLLELLGSRKPILFVEGTNASIDVELYSHVYPDRAVLPVESCSNVIHTTVAFGRLRDLHHLDSVGLIDRDQRTDEECEMLTTRRVFITPVSEAENLLLLETVMRTYASIRHLDDVDVLIDRVKNDVLALLDSDRERVATAMLNAYLEDHIAGLGGARKSESEILSNLQTMANSIGGIAAQFRDRVDEAVKTRDYDAALRLYPNKGLAARMSRHFGVANYKDDVIRLLRKDVGSDILDALRAALPTLAE